MQTSTFPVTRSDGQVFDTYLSLPPAGRGPGLLLLQEIFGVNAHIRAVADQYAMDGYVVMAPDVFWRQQPRVDLGYDEAGSQQARSFMAQLDANLAVQDLQAAALALRAHPALEGKVGALGYCMGGRLAYALAATGAIDAAVCYYGGRIQDNLGVAPAITVPILFHYAEQDAHIPLRAVAAVQSAFAGRANAQFHCYAGAEHGFNCWERPAYHQRTAALARGRTLQWLADALV
jgi:carboxymethylenebutenolidase